ncbi:MAG: MerR family transcriptional regulator [Bacteroidetes bacterium]|nr:MerR family transcriptional regulator [Bacteroidota bacterium]
MAHYSIKDVELLSGVKAHTLRIWEQRYDFCGRSVRRPISGITQTSNCGKF